MDLDGQGGIGRLIRASRADAGLTQQQLADAADVSVGLIRDLEQGRTERPQAESVRRLTRALRLDGRQAAELSRAMRGNSGLRAPARTGVLRLSLLGPVQAWRGGASISLGGPAQRAVLGLVALHPESGLRRAAIIDALWGDAPPTTAVAMIQSYVSRLRTVLGGGPDGPLTAVTGGYRLKATECELDHVCFAALTSRAREARAANDLTAACEAYSRALGLWRDDPLADVADILRDHPAVTQLSLERAAAVTGYAEAALAAGWHDRVLGELQALVGREPLNERAHAHLMAALAANGRQAAALSIYDELRRRLDDQIGVRPGAELAEAHARVLRQDIPAAAARGAAYSGSGSGPGTGYAAPSQPPGGPGRLSGERAVPRQLPAAVTHFTGRSAELAALSGLLNQAGEGTAGAVVISAIGGTAGVGKTALAVRWAHQSAERFPDGQLYVNLRGYDPGQPMPATDALAGFLRALGVAGQDIPAGEDERAARYRSLLAGKRVLVVLDNAGEAGQVRPLLPGAPACMAVVTSRDSLAGLVARDGAVRLDLDRLPLEEAIGLLRSLIGGRVDAGPAAAAALADQCSRLPLALRVAAELAAARPSVPLARLVGELTGPARRLDLLDAGGDSRTAVRAVFSWSSRQLDGDTSRAFRLLGLDPGPDLDPYAAAALIGTTRERAERALSRLTRAYLIQVAGPGRFALHDLLRAYAAEQATGQHTESERQAALTRLFDHYLHTAAAAMDTLFPAERDRRPRVAVPGTPAPPVTEPTAAREWLDAQRACLIAAAAHAADRGWPGHATRLAAVLYRYLDGGGHIAEAVTLHTCACRAARHTGDRAAEATALTSLGTAEYHLGRCEQATGLFQQALALFGETGHHAGQARALNLLGLVDSHLGRYEQAIDHYQWALTLFRDVGDRTGEAHVLGNLGTIDRRQGRVQQAADCLRQALILYREVGERVSEAEALTMLGGVELRLGRFQRAADCHEQALALSREIGERYSEADALNGLGEVSFAIGQPGRARTQHTAALGLASRMGFQEEQARAHHGLALSYDAIGDSGQARHHWQEALTLYTHLGGVPEADQVRAQLATAGDHGHREP